MSSRILAGRYEILEQIGEGGMSLVYKGKDRLLNRYVAIKILKKKYTKDAKLVESFKNESQAAAGIVSNNIVSVYDVGREGNINYIVMELIRGQLLSDIIKEKGRINYKEVVKIAIQITAGLESAHRNNIVHKDIKPQNILLTEDGTVKIADFGIAKFVDNATMAGNRKTVVGSVHYFSPEQARGGYVDEKSDIYSLGIVMYEMITGQVPFDGDNPVKIALMHINEEVKSPSEIVSNIPPTLERIIMKCTSKVQVDRYKSASELLKDLQHIESMTDLVGEEIYLGKKSSSKEVPNKNSVNKKENLKSGKNEEKYMSSGSKKKKTKFNKIKFAAFVTALFCAMLFVFAVRNIDFKPETTEVVKVPSIMGMTVDEAEEVLKAKGLELKVKDKVYDNEVDEGLIVSQTPGVDAKMKTGNIVKVNISKGTEEGTAPNLIGKTYEQAVNLIDRYGYEIGTVTVEDSMENKDIVLDQYPKPGESIKIGKSIRFTVSSGLEEGKTIVPKIVGLTKAEAEVEMKKADLVLGAFTEEISQTIAKGKITWQKVGAGEKLDKGSKIDYKVSFGSKMPEPQPISVDIDYSKAINPVFFITVTLIDENGTHNIYNGEQRMKEEERETLILNGKGRGSITVLFDNEEVMNKTLNFNTGEIN